MCISYCIDECIGFVPGAHLLGNNMPNILNSSDTPDQYLNALYSPLVGCLLSIRNILQMKVDNKSIAYFIGRNMKPTTLKTALSFMAFHMKFIGISIHKLSMAFTAHQRFLQTKTSRQCESETPYGVTNQNWLLDHI